MLAFIICEDNAIIQKSINSIINKYMFSSNIDYIIKSYNNYTEELSSYIKNNTNSNIYFLDIELANVSGLDIAREIRSCDWNSVIVFASAHLEMEYKALISRLMILDFVSKFDNFENRIRENLDIALNFLNIKKVYKIKKQGSVEFINISSILYVCKDSFERKSIIRTTNDTFYINKTIQDLKNELGNNFIQSHRSCIVNKDNIKKIDFKNNIIEFNNNESINLLSSIYKKEFREYELV